MKAIELARLGFDIGPPALHVFLASSTWWLRGALGGPVAVCRRRRRDLVGVKVWRAGRGRLYWAYAEGGIIYLRPAATRAPVCLHDYEVVVGLSDLRGALAAREARFGAHYVSAEGSFVALRARRLWDREPDMCVARAGDRYLVRFVGCPGMRRSVVVDGGLPDFVVGVLEYA